MSANSGVLVLGPVRPFDSTDTYPTCLSDEMLGGLHVGATLTALQAIPSPRLNAGMLGFTDDSNTFYKLGEDLTTWTPLSVIGSGMSGALPIGTNFQLVQVGANQLWIAYSATGGVPWTNIAQLA